MYTGFDQEIALRDDEDLADLGFSPQSVAAAKRAAKSVRQRSSGGGGGGSALLAAAKMQAARMHAQARKAAGQAGRQSAATTMAAQIHGHGSQEHVAALAAQAQQRAAADKARRAPKDRMMAAMMPRGQARPGLTQPSEAVQAASRAMRGTVRRAMRKAWQEQCAAASGQPTDTVDLEPTAIATVPPPTTAAEAAAAEVPTAYAPAYAPAYTSEAPGEVPALDADDVSERYLKLFLASRRARGLVVDVDADVAGKGIVKLGNYVRNLRMAHGRADPDVGRNQARSLIKALVQVRKQAIARGRRGFAARVGKEILEIKERLQTRALRRAGVSDTAGLAFDGSDIGGPGDYDVVEYEDVEYGAFSMARVSPLWIFLAGAVAYKLLEKPVMKMARKVKRKVFK